MIVHIVIDNKGETVFHFLTDTRMSVGISDTTVISSTKTEVRNLNAINASASQRDDSSPAPKNRHFLLVISRSCIRMSVGISDATVISPIQPEAHSLNTTIAPSVQQDGSPQVIIPGNTAEYRQYYHTYAAHQTGRNVNRQYVTQQYPHLF